MERVWLFDHLAVTVARTDFADPALAGEPDVRERGVRVEVRPVASQHAGSVYASPTTTVRPALCRVDLLESAPGAADRMHWHPGMREGEPGDRTFEKAMPADPVGWLTAFLDDLGDVVGADAEVTAGDLAAIRSAAAEIGAAVADGMAWARAPWPEVVHDDRGMAVAPPA